MPHYLSSPISHPLSPISHSPSHPNSTPPQVTEQVVGDEVIKKFARYSYPSMTKTQGNFCLHVESGDFTDSEILVMLGENGTGKTTFIRMLAGMTPPDPGSTEEGQELPAFNVRWVLHVCVCVLCVGV